MDLRIDWISYLIYYINTTIYSNIVENRDDDYIMLVFKLISLEFYELLNLNTLNRLLLSRLLLFIDIEKI